MNNLNSKRHLKKRLHLIEQDNGQMSSSVMTTSDVSDTHTKWEIPNQQCDENIESDLPSDLLELNTMFNFEPGSHCLVRKSSRNGRGRRNSTIACGMSNKIPIRPIKVIEKGDTLISKRRLSIATVPGPVQKLERKQQKCFYDRLTMIESMENEGKKKIV